MAATDETLTARERLARWTIVLGAAGVVLVPGPPEGITGASWRLFAIFVALFVGACVVALLYLQVD